jgi:hypothetical protein
MLVAAATAPACAFNGLRLSRGANWLPQLPTSATNALMSFSERRPQLAVKNVGTNHRVASHIRDARATNPLANLTRPFVGRAKLSEGFEYVEWVIIRSTCVVLLVVAAYRLIVVHLR